MPHPAKAFAHDSHGPVDGQNNAVKRVRFKNRWLAWTIYASMLLLAWRTTLHIGFYMPFFEHARTRSSGYTAWNFDIVSNNESLRFFPCPGQPTLECTNVLVPTDYFDWSAGTSMVATAILRGHAKEKKGSIFINPGGPGGSGVYFALRYAKTLSEIVQGEYDIVGFDPRGIGASRPVVQCFPSKFEFQAFKMGTVLERGFNLPPDPSSAAGHADIVQQWAQWRALFAAQYRICGEVYGEELKYMGTSTVVRDIDYMTQMFDGPNAPIHYFGGSYGSILGSYLVNMLPDRVGRVLIDGIVDPVLWANGATTEWLREWLVETEGTYQWLLEDCVKAGPGRCALAEKDSTAADIAKRIDDYLDELYYNPIPITNHSRPGILTSGQARVSLYFATQAPLQWPKIAQYFALAIKGDSTPLYAHRTTPPEIPPRPNANGDLARSAVSCADSYVSKGGASAEDLARSTIEVLKVTPRFGLSVPSIEPDGACEFWPTKGREPERFTGPFNHTLANPMLILSSSSDPVTPLASARLVNKLMANSSRLLIQDTCGHGTQAMGMSLCTAKAIRSYYYDGELPENETHCKGDHGNFDTDEDRSRTRSAMSVEDRQLAELLARSSEDVVRMRMELSGWGFS